MHILSFSVFVIVLVRSHGSSDCITIADPTKKKATPNAACVFPFVLKNKTINGCHPEESEPGKSWCSIKVQDGTRMHVKGNWGICPPECKIHGDSGCPPDHTCTYKADCTKINSEYESWKIMKRGTEKKKLEEKLKSQVCNKKPQRFCCPVTQHEMGLKKTTFPSSCIKEPITNFSGNILPLQGSCGLSCNSASQVVNGEEAKLGEFPWAALLGFRATRKFYNAGVQKYERQNFTLYKCGGTLINTWYVLTAGHCQGDVKSKMIYKVLLGEWEVSNKLFRNKDPDCTTGGVCMPPVQKILVEKVIVHTDYHKTRKGIFKDIALIRLKTEAVLNTAVQLACLPLDTSLLAAELQINGFGDELGGYNGTVIGWGHTQNYDSGDLKTDGVAKTILQKAQVPIISTEECQDIRSRGGITEEHLCAGGGEDEADSCKGDSGGGIFIKKNTTNEAEWRAYGYVQVGLVSYGSQECGDGSPGVYTRVVQYIQWIKLNLEP